MELILAALSALRTLVSNPKLGGGGLKSIDTVFMIGHIIELGQGGAKTAAALKEFTAQIQSMADAGYQPTSRDFDSFTTRLNTALDVIAVAKAHLQEEQGIKPAAAETAVDKAVEESKSDEPKESEALAALDQATVDAQEEQLDRPEEPALDSEEAEEEDTEPESAPKPKKGKRK